jgi:diacylglycerol kinase family enzyme
VLKIPLNWQEAIDLLFEDNDIYNLDVFRVAGHHFLLHMGVGISGIALRDTDLESKRLLGRLYYPFEGLRAFFGFQPHRFEIVIDGDTHHFKGTEVFVINSASIGDPFIRWSDSIRPTDGVLDVFFVRARTFFDFLRLAWHTILGRQQSDPGITYFQASESIHIRSQPTLPLQADGEYVTETPVTVELIPHAIQLISLSHDEMKHFGTPNE